MSFFNKIVFTWTSILNLFNRQRHIQKKTFKVNQKDDDHSSVVPVPSGVDQETSLTGQKMDQNGFSAIFPQLFDEFRKVSLNDTDPLILSRLTRLFGTVPFQSTFRGEMLPQIYSKLQDNFPRKQKMQEAALLGGIFQILQTSAIIEDDFLDHDEQRFGGKTWCAQENMNPIVSNDAQLLKSIAFQLLYKYFHNCKIFLKLYSYFIQFQLEYHLGQAIEHNLTLRDNADLNMFTFAKYKQYAKTINTKLIFGPLQLALVLANFQTSSILWKKIERTCEYLALFWTIRDDILDSYEIENGKPVRSSKVCAHGDIKAGKGHLLFITALNLCRDTTIETRLLTAYGGLNSNANVDTILNIFDELNVPQKCMEEMNAIHMETKEYITQNFIECGHSVGFVLIDILNRFAKLKKNEKRKN